MQERYATVTKSRVLRQLTRLHSQNVGGYVWQCVQGYSVVDEEGVPRRFGADYCEANTTECHTAEPEVRVDGRDNTAQMGADAGKRLVLCELLKLAMCVREECAEGVLRG